MIQNFRTYDLAIQFYKECRSTTLPHYLKDQLMRASSSIALNLAEGSGKHTHKDQRRFFFIALGSLRECQAALDLSPTQYFDLMILSDNLGAHLYKLCHCKKWLNLRLKEAPPE